MLSPKRSKTLAHDFLEQFDGDLIAAINALQKAYRRQRMEERPDLDAADKPTAVELHDITKTYKLGSQKIMALNNISLTIKQGEFVALTGPSGSGKSTLLQLIGGLDKPSKGRVVVDGSDISKLRDRKLSKFRNRTVGFVFQFFYLQPFLTMQSNLEVPGMFARLPKKQRAWRASELAEKVDLTDRLKHLPKELSGGQMQRAAIARALLNEPKILLADEPTGNLDQTNGQAIIELFDKVREMYGTTIIMVTHDQTIAASADREIRLTDGEVVRG